MRARKMSRELRIDIEMLLEDLIQDAPYLNPDAVIRLRRRFGIEQPK